MILYAYFCPACWSTAERFVASEQRDSNLLCAFCLQLNYVVSMQRSLTVPAIRGETISKS